MPRIAVVDDDEDWALFVTHVFKDSGFDVAYHATPGRLFDSLLKHVPDVLLLDMQLPGMHGREVLRVLRANDATKRLLIVAVSAHDRKSEHAVKAFENGADEYFAKPVDPDLMIARVAALLRRGTGAAAAQQQHHEPPIRLGNLTVLPEQRTATLKEKPISLTNLEFELLVYFLRQPNRVLTRSLILETVWGTAPDLNTRTVDKHVESLRRKLGPLGKKVETVVGTGYVLRV